MAYRAVPILEWRHNGHVGVSNHQLHGCLLNRLFRGRSKKTWKLRVTGLCEGNSPVTGEFPAQRASNAENVSIWWRHHEITTRHNKSQIVDGNRPDSELPQCTRPISHTTFKSLERKCAHLCFKIVHLGSGTGALWDWWHWSLGIWVNI